MKQMLFYSKILTDLCLQLIGVNYIINPIIINTIKSDYIYIILSVNIAFAILSPFMVLLQPTDTDKYSLLIAISIIVQYYKFYQCVLYCSVLFLLYNFSKNINEEYRFNFNTTFMLFFIKYTLTIYAIDKFINR